MKMAPRPRNKNIPDSSKILYVGKVIPVTGTPLAEVDEPVELIVLPLGLGDIEGEGMVDPPPVPTETVKTDEVTSEF
jgi:hypothetical protein